MSRPMKTEAISNFLNAKTLPDLASLYEYSMECQVNVAQDGGERVEKEYKGRKWHGWTDGLSIWKSFRVPWNAKSEPEYKDSQMSWDLAAHAEAIGMTGWDWQNLRSRWVGFDFDAISGHSENHNRKLTTKELEEVKQAVFDVEWVTIRKSTSGTGLHLYVFLENFQTENHTEHAALARAILGKLSAVTGFDFSSKVDVCGGNMWVWHRKMQGTRGLELIKEGVPLTEVPKNWRDHLNVIQGSSRRCVTKGTLEDLVDQRTKIDLDSTHKELIKYLEDSGHSWWWDQDHGMLVTHTAHLKEAHESLNLKGVFETTTKHGSEINCFAFPLRGGAWSVRRYTQGVAEHESWFQDGSGWTHCYLNRDPDVGTACRAQQGIENTKGAYEFRECAAAVESALLMGISLSPPAYMAARPTLLKQHKDGRIIISIRQEDSDKAEDMKGWLIEKGYWVRIFHAKTVSNRSAEPEVGNYDDLVRHIVTENEDAGWVLQSGGTWRLEPMNHVRAALTSIGMSGPEVSNVIGNSIFKPWILVNRPFQPEYTGGREWNRFGAQLRYSASEGLYPTWQSLLDHVGHSLDEAVKEDPWCCINGVVRGADYMLCWIASLIQHPEEPLPYLFMYGPQDSGKSSLHESLELLFDKGYINANAAMDSGNTFNGEMEGAILCYVEEKDLNKNKQAYNKMKEWVTARQLLVHYKNRTPFQVPNTTHWIHCANDYASVPIFPGDTRVTMIYVDSIDPLEMIPKRVLMEQLAKEAPAFLYAVQELELPDPTGRLHIPVLATDDKKALEINNMPAIESFIMDKCQLADGHMIVFADFYDQFIKWCDPMEASNWTKKRVGKSIPVHFCKGRKASNNQVAIGNIAWKGAEIEETNKKYRLHNDVLRLGDK